MVRNEISIARFTIKSAHEILVLVILACGEGSVEPACVHDLAWAFASRINKVCKLKKNLNNF